ncbi:MAG TPA: AAA family ATPase, partial [Streptosporangiaceae bacterium]|nr:AAA family ATPase [Streptosporangiaceae bacterium]
MISGEAGIGKTAMLAALVSRSGPAPLVLRGFCWEGDGAPPYWPWSQVLQASGLPMADLGEAGWLLQPAAGPAEPLGAVAAGDAQFRLFEAVARCLGRLAAGSGFRPVLVVLDDLHWADEPSLRLLGFLARALPAEPVALLGAYRDTEASPELLKIAGQAQQLALAGLTQDDVEALAGELAGTALPAQVTAQLWQRSGGNPFFVRELIRLLQAQGSWHQPAQIPASVAETLRRRLARLSTECVRLLEWAAIAGRDVDVAVLAHGAAVGPELAALSLLDEARQAGVIAGTSPPRFTHDLYRETILDGLSTSARTAINLSVGRTLQARSGPAARIAAHLLAAGPSARQDALGYSLLAAREATARLGHEDACAHYLRALHVISERGALTAERVEILLELAASHERTGRSDLAAQRYREAADVSRMAADAIGVARAALGIQTLGYRSGAQNAELLDLLREASRRLEAAGGPVALQSRVLAALARALRHGTDQLPGAEVISAADEAVRLAEAAQDASALATAKLAAHDAMWVPGTAARRLPVIAEILDAAQASGDDDLAAEAHLLRAAALLELGDPAGRDGLLSYVTLAGQLGHARGRWGALTRQATFAQLAGRPEEAARLGEQALELGLAIGEPDAVGCFYTLRAALTVFGVSGPPMELDAADPLWPMLPVLKAWPFAARGEAAAAAAVLGDFSVLDITMWTGLEALAAAAVVFAAAGSDAQRTWVYERLRPYAGSHVVVGGCASYHAAVDHHLGALAASLGDTTAAGAHFRAALAMHERLGAAGWARLSEQALARLEAPAASQAPNELRLVNGVRLLCFEGKQVQLPDSKGLADIATLIGARGADVHVLTLVGHHLARMGADPVLDQRAKKSYQERLACLAEDIEDAEAAGRAGRAEVLRNERDALIRELAAAAGLGHRDRKLGDEAERARKTVSARVRDALSKIGPVHPELAAHLRGSLRLGTRCSYSPPAGVTWKVN